MGPFYYSCMGFVVGCWFHQGLRYIERKIGDKVIFGEYSQEIKDNEETLKKMAIAQPTKDKGE